MAQELLKRPTPQAVQVAALVVSAYVPGLQARQCSRRDVLAKKPAGHEAQVVELSRYVPGMQGRQIACPSRVWYRPVRHWVHVRESSSAARAQPAGHLEHDSADAALYLPPEHAVHVVFPAPAVTCPALQLWQLVWSVSFVYVFRTQSSHSFMPCSLPYLPGTQARQMVWPL